MLQQSTIIYNINNKNNNKNSTHNNEEGEAFVALSLSLDI
jgi:hypothetical protein